MLHIPTYRVIDVPVYGNPSEVDQIEVEVDAPPDPEEPDGTAWEDFFPNRPVYLYGTE